MFSPRHPVNQAGLAHQQQGRWPEAAGCYHQAAAEAALESRFMLAWLAYEQGLAAEAGAHLAAVLAADPEFGPARLLLGKLAEACQARNWTFHQARCLEQILKLNPQDIRTMEKLSLAWAHLGQHEAQRELFHRLLGIGPGGRAWAASLPPAEQARLAFNQHVYVFQYLKLLYTDPAASDQQLFDYVDRLPDLPGQREAFAMPDPARPLRVAYLSREFAIYSSMLLFLPLLTHHSKAVELYAYSDIKEPTAYTRALMPCFAHWRNTQSMTNAELAAQIRSDEIDILVDLAGLTHVSRYGVFARHPAPVQVSGLGFVFSSCMRDMDYCFSDQVLCPPDIAARYPEQVVCLRSVFHWQPPADLAQPEPPCLQNGYVTLGSASTLNKLNRRVVALWAQILQQLPDARLFLKTPVFNDPLTRSFYTGLFGHFGIEAARLRFEGQGEELHISYFYAQIDIALDPFPYQGGVTSCEALWMGVPVLSLALPQWRTRALTAAILTHAGLQDWLAVS